MHLRKKIYTRQKSFMEKCYNGELNNNEKKMANGEILILEEILDIKNHWYNLETNKFWKNL